jgi:hypothetical protein
MYLLSCAASNPMPEGRQHSPEGSRFYLLCCNPNFSSIIFESFFILPLYQEVEDEAGAAGEQPVSNKLPALHCNIY